MLQGVKQLGLPGWALDVAPPVREHAPDMAIARDEAPPPGAPLVLHINAPLLPLAMLRLGRRVPRHRRIIG